MVSINDPSFSSILSAKGVVISLLTSIQSIVFVSGRISPHNFETFSISPQQAYSFCCWISNNSVQSFIASMLLNSIMVEVVFCSSFSFPFNDLASILLFRRHCDVALFNHHLELWRSCSCHAYPFNRSVVSSAQALFFLSSLAIRNCSSLFLFSNGVFSNSFIFVVFFLSMA